MSLLFFLSWSITGLSPFLFPQSFSQHISVPLLFALLFLFFSCYGTPYMGRQIPGSDPQNPRYVANMANMVRYMRSKLVKCTVRDRYGKESARIMEVMRSSSLLYGFGFYPPAQHFRACLLSQLVAGLSTFFLLVACTFFLLPLHRLVLVLSCLIFIFSGGVPTHLFFCCFVSSHLRLPL